MARKRRTKKVATRHGGGKLRIGDDWNAITIIALSQSNPLKAVAEFVENSIDANARKVVIAKGRKGGDPYLRIADDGDGIPRDVDGVPDFHYVATHICDSLKRRMKAEGATGIQGEFGIGLMSFWTVGETLTLTCAGADGKTYQMRMKKGDPGYQVRQRRTLFPQRGTELTIKPLLAGIRRLSGEKMQWYLASELRDRIRTSGVRIDIIDRQARKQYRVEPRQYSGRLLHQIEAPNTEFGEVHAELYLAEPADQHRVELYRAGTRVLDNVASLEAFSHAPWNSPYLQGIVDAPFLSLTPGTRSGVIQDRAFAALRESLRQVEAQIGDIIEAQRRAEEERASRNMLRSIRKALREALLALPAEEYDWFDLNRVKKRPGIGGGESVEAQNGMEGLPVSDPADEAADGAEDTDAQKQFFEFAGPLFGARISPASSVLRVGRSRTLRALARDRAGRQVEDDLAYRWRIDSGAGRLGGEDAEIVHFHAPAEPDLTRVSVTVSQRDIEATAEAVVTVTDTLLSETSEKAPEQKGLPGYTFRRAPGELWRSRYDAQQNLIVINNGHRDFVFASRNRALKLRYIARLFAKEMVLRNFPGEAPQQILERMIELSLYTEENLR